MFDVVINDGTNDIPDSPVVYVVGKSGVFLKKNLGLMESIVKVDKISILEDIEEQATMNFKRKMPEHQVGKIVKFFKDVYNKYKGEANMVLHYREHKKKGGQYFLQPVEQEVSGGSVKYVNEVVEGWQRIGTVHSHGSGSAFHSGVDDKDEEDFDGLHITLGNVNQDEISISASIVANGTRFKVEPQDYLDGIEKVEKHIASYTPSYKRLVYKDGKFVEQDVKRTVTSFTTEPRYISTASVRQSCYPKKWLSYVRELKYVTMKDVDPRKLSNFYGEAYDYYYRKRNQSIIDSFNPFEIEEDTKDEPLSLVPEGYDPCNMCPYRDYKSDILFKEILDLLDDDQLDALGFPREGEDGIL